MDGFVSLSQGFSLHKPKRKSLKHAMDNMNKIALQHYSEPSETAPLRQKLCEEAWEYFSTKIDEHQNDWYSVITSKIKRFLTVNGPSASGFGLNKIIPTAIFITDLTSEDHSLLFDSMFSQQKLEFPLAARASSISCANVKSGFQCIAKQLMEINLNVNHLTHDSQNRMDTYDSDDENMNATFYETSGCNKRQASIQDLNTWYKSASRDVNNPRVVLIILDDVDMFNEDVTRQLMELLSCCDFPFIMVLGVLHGFCRLEQMLPCENETPFTYEKILASDSPYQRFDSFFSVVMLDWQFPFRLSGDVIKVLSDYFWNVQFSIKKLMMAYKLCLVAHFRSPMSVFCARNHHDVCQKMMCEFSEEACETSLNSIPSWQKYLREREVLLNEQRDPGTSLSAPKPLSVNKQLHRLDTSLSQCCKRFLDWNIMFLFIFEIGRGLPGRPIGSDLFEAFYQVWNGELFRSETPVDKDAPEEIPTRIEKIILLVNNYSKDEMCCRLKDAVGRVKGFLHGNRNSKVFNMNDAMPHLRTMEAFLTRMRDIQCGRRSGVNPAPSPSTSTAPATDNLFELREKMLKRIKSKTADPEYDELKDNIKCFIRVQSLTKLNAFPNTSIPFSEIIVFNDVRLLKDLISPNAQLRIHTALSHPHGFLSCDCCKDLPPDSNDKNLPDASILYKLVLETRTKNVNLNDLFVAFKSIMEGEEYTRKASTSQKTVQEGEAYLIRFKQAISELEYLGFLKHSNSKPDEVQRMKWDYSYY